MTAAYWVVFDSRQPCGGSLIGFGLLLGELRTFLHEQLNSS